MLTIACQAVAPVGQPIWQVKGSKLKARSRMVKTVCMRYESGLLDRKTRLQQGTGVKIKQSQAKRRRKDRCFCAKAEAMDEWMLKMLKTRWWGNWWLGVSFQSSLANEA